MDDVGPVVGNLRATIFYIRSENSYSPGQVPRGRFAAGDIYIGRLRCAKTGPSNATYVARDELQFRCLAIVALEVGPVRQLTSGEVTSLPWPTSESTRGSIVRSNVSRHRPDLQR